MTTTPGLKAVLDVGALVAGPAARIEVTAADTLKLIASADDAAAIRSRRGELTFDDPEHSGLTFIAGL
jgi:hypothetical protein